MSRNKTADMNSSHTAFIIGPPRSGTSILSQVIDQLPGVANWFEPYFVWDRYFRDAPNDLRSAADATPQVAAYIRDAFEGFRRARQAEVVVDKAPRNCLKLPFINAVFPNAKYIILVRDGRETILSIYRKWQKQAAVLEKSHGWGKLKGSWDMIWESVMYQPLWRHRWQFLAFHLGPPSGWLRGRFISTARWQGRPGWGPQFAGWQELFGKIPVLEFCAHQWVHCVREVMRHQPDLPAQRCLPIRYEEFTAKPQENFRAVADFLEVDYPQSFMEQIPAINSNNTSKWRTSFTAQELRAMGPIISQTLIALGYEPDDRWYQDLTPEQSA